MLKNLVESDIVEKLGAKLESMRWYMDTTSKKYSCLGRTAYDSQKTWVYVNPKSYDNCCTVYTAIVEEVGFIPSPCLNCWKVVVKPFTLYELFKLYEFEKAYTKDCMGTDRFCKCGIEERPWVNYNYGGYFYNDSKEQGLQRWKEVREAVDKINPDIPVILKRYCTEFELKLGPSDLYEWTPWMDKAEKMIFDAIDFTSMGENAVQPDYLIRHCMRKWIEFAYDRGDATALLFNENEPLYSPTITYHPGGTAEERAKKRKENKYVK